MEILRLSGASPDELLRAALVAVPLAVLLLFAHLRRSRPRVGLALLEAEAPGERRRA